MAHLHALENDYWQVGILPETGASVAYGRVNVKGKWVNLLRPTPEADLTNAFNTASYLLIPWSNRLRNSQFTYNGIDYKLRPVEKFGIAIHGAVLEHTWRIVESDDRHIILRFDSHQHKNVNFPFAFSAKVTYFLEDRDFNIHVELRNEDGRRMPAGFGHHPYFLRHPDGIEDTPEVEIPCDKAYELVNALPTEAAKPIPKQLDFRQQRPLGDEFIDDLLTGRQTDKPIKIVFPKTGAQLTMYSDPIFSHTVLYSPPQKPYFAIEPVTNANDGFNLHAQGIEGTGVFVLQPGTAQDGSVRLTFTEL